MISFGEIASAEQAHSGFYTRIKVSKIKKWTTYLHSDAQNLPDVFLNVEHLNAIVYFLFSAAEEPSESIDTLVIDGASR